MADVILLLCSERSGSNLISRIFGMHEDLCAPGPAHLLRVFGENYHRYNRSENGWNDFVNDLNSLFNTKVSSWAIDDDWQNIYSDICSSRKKNIAKCLIDIYLAEAKINGKKVLFIKENQAYKYLPFIMTNVERIRLVYMVRDPRDMALSWLKSPLARGGVVRAVKNWVQDQENFLRVISWLDNSCATASFTYEALLKQPDVELKNACSQLELCFDSNMLSFHKSLEASINSAGSVDWSNTGRPLMKNNSGKFLNGLDKNQIAYIEFISSDLMKALGYDPVTPSSALFGDYETFEDLEESMNNIEPWDKPGYKDVPEVERNIRKQWVIARNNILQRPIYSHR